MSVEFENDRRGTSFPPGSMMPGMIPGMMPGQPQTGFGMAGWLMQKGIIRDESQAKTLLLGVVCFNFILMALIFYFFVF